MRTRLGQTVAIAGCLFFIVNGLWAFLATRSFFDYVGTWPPYNEHFLRDAGSFSLGVGAALGLSLVSDRASLCTLAGGAAAATAHALSHIIDLGDGGRSSDPYLLSSLALLLVVALVRERKELR